jgi:hypothetical protein
MTDPSDFDLLFDDIVARHGGRDAFTPSTMAIARKLAIQLANEDADPRLLLELEELLPPKGEAATPVKLADYPLYHWVTGKVYGWDYSDDPRHREALRNLDHPSVPEQFRLPTMRGNQARLDLTVLTDDELDALEAITKKAARNPGPDEAMGVEVRFILPPEVEERRPRR